MLSFDIAAAEAQSVRGCVESPAEQRAGGEGRLAASYTLTFVSDYRISGVSSSGKAAALQGSIDVEDESGWSAGIWASNIKEFAGSSVEIDLYGAKSFALDDTEISLGATLIYLAGGENITVGLAEAGIARAIGPFDASLDFRYAWPQSELDGEDDFYVELSGASPIGRLAGYPLTLGASVGYEEGIFVSEGTKLDWSFSLTAEVGGLEIGLSYVDTNVNDENGDPGCIFSLSQTF